MSWTDRLTRAAFRGVEFLTESHDAKGGRRLAVHEYPGAEEPEVEDLGSKAWDWKLNAYFIGTDYDLPRNKFLDALNTPGADWLTHPWLGQLWVRAQTWSLHESTDKGGYCTIGIEWVPGGGSKQPALPDAMDVAVDRAAKFADAAVADFDLKPMSIEGMTAFVAAMSQKLDGLRQAISMSMLPVTRTTQINRLITELKGDLATLAGIPVGYAAALRNLTDVLGAGVDGSGLADSDRPRAAAGIVRAAASMSTAPVGITGAGSAVHRNMLNTGALCRRLLVTAAIQTSLADYHADADRDAALTCVVAAIDALLPGLPDPVFQAAMNARAALIGALLAQDLKPATVRDIAAPLPAVVLAHRLGVDEAAFIARNAVRHPLFVMGRVYG